METNTLCRLCSFNCNEFKCLYDDNEEATEVYKISAKYFESSLLDAGVICTECWQHIYNFYGFQQWILNAQANHINFDEILCEKKLVNSSSNLKDFPNEKSSPLDTPNITVNQCEDNKTEKNPYKCETCGASFTQYGNLRRHVRKKHKLQPLRKWTCQYCNKTFKNRSYLEKHRSQTHSSKDSEEDINFESLDYEEEENSDKKSSKAELVLNENACEKARSESKDVIEVFTIKESEVNLKAEIELMRESQIQEPALDIVDIKDETDTESDSDVIEQPENMYIDIDKENISYDDLIDKWKKSLECPKCKTNFTNFSMLNEHFQLEHLEERCYIKCCDELLYDPRSIVQHMQLHENPNAFKCVDCEKMFKNSKGLNSHRLQVHSENRSAYHLHLCYCKRAKEIYANNNTSKEQKIKYDTVVCCQRKKKILEDDALIAEWKKDLKCRLCNTTFPYYSLMRAHFYCKHPGEKCYISCCQRKITRISDALDHIRFHLDPNMYKCNICNTTFSGKKGLSKHMNLAHEDSLPKYKWACDECNKSFKIRQILIRHKNVNHTKKF